MEWIDVKDRLPEMNEWCLIYFGSPIPIIANYKGDNKFFHAAENEFWLTKEDDVTFWMPLPKPPLTEDEAIKQFHKLLDEEK